MTADELKKRYRQLSDQELTRIALKDSKDLRPEALAIMKAEMQRRNLMAEASSGIEVQLKELSTQELLMYCDTIQSLPCPVCSKTTSKLNAILIGDVVSLFFITFYEKKLVIACPSCLKDKNQTAKIKSILFGWWGIGIITMFKALALNNTMSKQIDQPYPTSLLENFVIRNVGKIESYKNNPEQLEFMLKHPKV